MESQGGIRGDSSSSPPAARAAGCEIAACGDELDRLVTQLDQLSHLLEPVLRPPFPLTEKAVVEPTPQRSQVAELRLRIAAVADSVIALHERVDA
jgi:hypothetical protein